MKTQIRFAIDISGYYQTSFARGCIERFHFRKLIITFKINLLNINLASY